MTEQQSAPTSILSLLGPWDDLLAALASSVIVTDVRGRIVIWNRAAADLFGWPADKAIGRPIMQMLVKLGVNVDAVEALSSAASGRRWSDDVECRHRDGSRVPMHLAVGAIHGPDRSVIGFVCEARDSSDVSPAEWKARGTESFFCSLLAHSSEVVCITDSDAVVKYVFQAGKASLDYSPQDTTGRSAFDFVHPDDLTSLKQAFADVTAGVEIPTVVYRARTQDDSWRWREARLTNHLGEASINGIVCNIRDVTEHQEAMRRLREAEARQSAVLARSRDATLFFDGDGTIRWASPPTAELFGMPPDELLGRNGLDFIHPDDREGALIEFASMTHLGDHRRIEIRVINARGEQRWFEEDATNLVDDPDVGYVVANLRDITERRRAQEQLANLALHDSLTGLPNRSLVVNRLEQLIARGRPAAILYIDLDNFGDVNDSLGYAAGDELLRLVSWRLSSALAGMSSTLARVGGDEFVVLCDDVADATAAVVFAERLRGSLRLPFDVAGEEIFVAVSIGVAVSPGDATGLMRDAGIATHQAKQQGRDRIAIFEARLDSTQRHRLGLQSELRHALERDELRVWYQPMIKLDTGEISGVEALVRWQHPDRGLLAPQHFVEIAETSGLIRALGRHVLQIACADLREWMDLGFPLRISVNAAAAQLTTHDFVEEIESALDEFAIDAERMTIEITETAAMQVVNSLDVLQGIRSRGLHLALDDFGTGYSSLSFLRELPVDAIKIDRTFISGLGTNSRDTSIVQGVLAIATALGHAVVAEGVEDEAQADALRRLACGYAQGYLWSKPVPASEICGLVSRLGRGSA